MAVNGGHAGTKKGPNWGHSRAAKRGCFKRGGFPIWTCPSFFVLFCPFLSFLGLSRFFWDFPDLLGDGPGIFPIRPFSLSRPIKSTYEEQSRKGPRHNRDLSRKKWETPRFGLASLKRFFSSHEFCHEKCSEVFPENLEPLFCGSEKFRKIPSKFPTKFSKFPCEVSKTNSPTSFCRGFFLGAKKKKNSKNGPKSLFL